MDRIGESPGTYDGTNQENPDQQNARTWTEELGEDNSEAACPLGFMQESPIATVFCSDIDEVGFIFCSHLFTNMTHIGGTQSLFRNFVKFSNFRKLFS